MLHTRVATGSARPCKKHTWCRVPPPVSNAHIHKCSSLEACLHSFKKNPQKTAGVFSRATLLGTPYHHWRPNKVAGLFPPPPQQPRFSALKVLQILILVWIMIAPLATGERLRLTTSSPPSPRGILPPRNVQSGSLIKSICGGVKLNRPQELIKGLTPLKDISARRRWMKYHTQMTHSYVGVAGG